MTVKDFMANVDARILRAPVVRADAVIAGVEVVGAFERQYREIILPNGEIASVAMSFDTRWIEEFANLANGDVVEIEGERYRFLREVLPGGDESGMTRMDLGELL